MKAMKDQSYAARQQRLDQGFCPIHGFRAFLGQVDGWYFNRDGSLHECPTCGCSCHGEYTIGQCDYCDVRATYRSKTMPNGCMAHVEVGCLLGPEWLVKEMADGERARGPRLVATDACPEV